MSARKRPPRTLWLLIDGVKYGVYDTRRAARAALDRLGPSARLDVRVVGPYVLAERVRER